MLPERAEVVVMGAGPAGSALAAYLARDGVDVLLLDATDAPQDRVGESLLPAANDVLDELGIEMGAFTVKTGAVFTRDGAYHRFPFDGAARPRCGHTWQVRRSTFDTVMREAAVAAGARFEVARVTDVDLPGTVLTDAGTVSCDTFVDAAGRGQWLARRLGLRELHPQLRNAAMYAPFTGVRRFDYEVDGDIVICDFSGGWFWFIDHGTGPTSVGVVMTPDFPRGRGRWERALERCPDAAARLEGATALDEVRGVSDFTAYASRFHGDGWALCGDAALFLDPVFSSGVAFALHGARDLARSLQSGDLDGYEARIRAASKPIEEVVLAWYDGSFLDLALSGAPEVSEGRVREWIISLLAGDVFDPSFRGSRWVAGRIARLGSYVA